MIKTLLILSMVVNYSHITNPNHNELFRSVDRVLFVRGGANAGKSYSIADKLLMQGLIQQEKDLKSVIIRKSFPALRTSTLDILQKRARALYIPFNLNKSDWIAQSLKHKFVFLSLNNTNDYEKLMSITDVDYIWSNEVPEIRQDDFRILLTRLRGGESNYKQFIGDFNPVSKYHWLYDTISQKQYNCRELVYNIDSNPWASVEEVEALKETKQYDENFYKIYFKGEWGELEGVIYNWDVCPLPDISFDEIFYGGDFGYSVDPAAFVKVYRKADEFWVEELIYETGLTNQQLSERIKATDYQRTDTCYFDSAEPKSIQELCDQGINAVPCEKGPDSVRAGIDYLKSVPVHIIEGSPNIIKETRSYIWKKDKDGNSLNVPVPFNDHCMDAVRYAIHTHCKRRVQQPFIFRVRQNEMV